MGFWSSFILFINRYVNWSVPESLQDNEDLYRQARIIAIFALMGFVFLTLNLFKWVSAAQWHLAASIGIVILTLISMLIMMRKKERVLFAAQGILLVLFLHFGFLAFQSGGIESRSFLWNLSLPLFAVYLSGKNSGIFWTVVTSTEFMAFYFFREYGFFYWRNATQVQELINIQSQLTGQIWPFVAIVIMAYLLEKERRGAIEEKKHMQRKVGIMSDNLKEVFNQVETNSSKLSELASDLKSTSMVLGNVTTETSGKTGNIKSSSNQINRNLGQVANSAETVSETAKVLSISTSDAVRTADKALRKTQNANKTIVRLGKSSEEIGNITSVITSITGQIKLLALNASIEAARAGEMGKGFAVVASEIKALAAKTTQATRNITHMIENIQTDTTEVVEEMGEIKDVIQKASDLQHEMSASVANQDKAMTSMSGLVSHSLNNSTEIMNAMTGLESSTKEGMNHLAGLLNSSSLLASMSSSLTKAIRKRAWITNDLRRQERYETDFMEEAVFDEFSDDEKLYVDILDISRGGMQVYAEHVPPALTIGNQISFFFEFAKIKKHVRTKIVGMHKKNSKHVLHLQFTNMDQYSWFIIETFLENKATALT